MSLSGDLESDARFQTAVLWKYENVTDGTGRRLATAEPRDICVRWEWDYTERSRAASTDVIWDAYVVVNEDIPVGSWLWYGSLEDFSGTGSGGDFTEIMQVEVFRRTPDVLGQAVRRVCLCSRYGDKIPYPE